jgi:hypothetical protein
MSAPEKKSIREMMRAVPGADKTHFADALSTIDPKNLPARTRTISPFATATLKTLSASSQRESTFKDLHGQQFQMHTVAGRMDLWQFTYDSYQISNGGEGRHETERVLSLAAIGNQDEEGRIASSVLNEGSKNLTGKNKDK